MNADFPSAAEMGAFAGKMAVHFSTYGLPRRKETIRAVMVAFIAQAPFASDWPAEGVQQCADAMVDAFYESFSIPADDATLTPTEIADLIAAINRTADDGFKLKLHN